MISTLMKAQQEHLPATLEELGTNPDQLNKDIAAMREWYSYQKHLPQDIEDTVLGSFIVGCKNSMEIAKMKLDMYYSERKRYAEIFSDWDPTGHVLVRSYKTVYTSIIPTLTPDGSAVVMVKLRNPDPNIYDAMEPLKRINMILELNLQKMIMNSKTYLLYDFEQFSNAHLTQLNLLRLKTHLEMLKFLPIRVKGIISINCSKFVETSFNLLRNFMSEKLKERLFVYAEGASVLSKHIPAEILPKDCGGQGAYTLDDLNDYWYKQLVENRAWFLDEKKHFSDESKRPGDSRYHPEAPFGVDGSFKKLSID